MSTFKLKQKEKCSLNTCKRKCIIFNPICRTYFPSQNAKVSFALLLRFSGGELGAGLGLAAEALEICLVFNVVWDVVCYVMLIRYTSLWCSHIVYIQGIYRYA